MSSESNEGLSNAQKALLKWREDNPNHVYERLSPADKAKANPKSKALAIRAYCYECTGGNKDEVTNCPVIKCPLHIHRPWQPKV